MITISPILLFLVSILPGILWVWYFYKKDKYDPEPKGLIARDFIWGMISVFPVSFLESPFSPLLTNPPSLFVLLLASILVVGLIEEGAKSLLVYGLHFNHPDFDEALDGIIYGITIGLGFAAAENLFYTIMYGYQVGLVRAVLTSLAHASFTGIFGYYLAMAKQQNNKNIIWSGFILVSILHGIYDFLVIGELISFTVTVMVIISLQIYLAYLIEKLLARSPFRNS